VYLGYLTHSGALDVGEHYDASRQVTIPAGAGASYYLFVVTDYNNGVYEFLYEGNNVAGRAVIGDDVPPTVDATTPSGVHDSGHVLPTNTQVEVTFSEPLDPADAGNPANYELRDDGANDILGDADDVIYPLTPSYTPGETAVTLGIDGAPVAGGHYRLTILGDDSIHDPAGNRLDGDGDSLPGGNYVRDFTIALWGDTDLNDTVNYIDLGNLATHYDKTPRTWAEGDFDGNGTVNYIDLGLLATYYDKSLPPMTPAGPGGAGSADVGIPAGNGAQPAAALGAAAVAEAGDLAILAGSQEVAPAQAPVSGPDDAAVDLLAATPAGARAIELDDYVDLLAGPDLSVLTLPV